RAEMERIFQRTWLYVAHEHELKRPGDYVSTTIADQPIFVVRDRELQLRAFYNTCTHRGAVLAPGSRGSCGSAFRSMYHGWTFNLQGRLSGVPSPDAYGPNFRRARYGLSPVHVDTFAGMIFVSLKPAVPSLEAYLGEAAPHLRKYGEGTEVLGRVRWRYHGN